MDELVNHKLVSTLPRIVASVPSAVTASQAMERVVPGYKLSRMLSSQAVPLFCRNDPLQEDRGHCRWDREGTGESQLAGFKQHVWSKRGQTPAWRWACNLNTLPKRSVIEEFPKEKQKSPKCFISHLLVWSCDASADTPRTHVMDKHVTRACIKPGLAAAFCFLGATNHMHVPTFVRFKSDTRFQKNADYIHHTGIKHYVQIRTHSLMYNHTPAHHRLHVYKTYGATVGYA